MVGPRLLLTNNHVLTDAGQAADSVVEFEYFVRADGSPSTIRVFKLQPEIFFKTDPDLDFSLVAVAEVGENGTVLAAQGWNQLINRHLGDSAAHRTRAYYPNPRIWSQLSHPFIPHRKPGCAFR